MRDSGVDAFTSMVDTGESSPDAVTPVDTGTPVDAPGLDAPRECTMAGECAPAENATARCESNHCVYDCIDGFDDCDGALGCEQAIDVASHCGSCTNDCGATGYCEGGSCGAGVTRGWLTRIRGAGRDQRPRNVLVDAARNRVLVFGYVEGGVDLTVGGVSTTGGGGAYDGYLVSLSFGGTVQWATNIGGAGEDSVLGIAVTPTGDVLVAGSYTASFDGLPPVRAGSDGFLMRVSDDGATHTAVDTWNGTGDDAIAVVELARDGSVMVLGQFSADTRIAGTLRSPAAGPGDIAVVRYTASFIPSDVVSFGSSGPESYGGHALVLQGARPRVLFGFTGTVDLGSAGRFDSTPPTGDDVLLLELDPSDLHVISAMRFGGPAQDYAYLTSAPEGLVLLFEAHGAIDLGGPPIPAPATSVVVALGLDARDAFAWQFVLSGAAANETAGLSSTGSSTYVSVRFTSPTLSVGEGPRLTRRGLRDGALVSLDRDGRLRWVEHYFGDADCYINPLGIGAAASRLFVSGMALGTCSISTERGDVSSPVVDGWVHAIDP